MDADAFWQLIEQARSGQEVPADADAVAEVLVSLLVARGEREILAFDAVRDEVDAAALRWICGRRRT